MFNVRLTGDHLYGKLLFTWLSLVTSLMSVLCCPFTHEMSWMRSGTELPRAALLFWFCGGLDVVCGYVLLFLLDINVENR